MTPVVFPPAECPLVSVVMVTYGGFEWILGALQALVDHTDPPYEVIVVDNASPDGTGPRLRDAVEGATVVLNEVNVGFGAGANQGALLAVGRHVFFLNSDAFVRPGWLPPLLAALDGAADVAAAASRLVDPDGTLQEAGGLIGANGYAGQLGMGADPSLPEYRFVRQVDFASAAALLVRRRELLAVGGFDPAYVLGYFEDVDLCLRLAETGWRTVYAPASVVSHLRGASTAPGEAQRRAIASHAVFVERWAGELERRPPLAELDAYPHRLFAARDHLAGERVLVVAVGPPDAHLALLVDRLAGGWPTARITLMAGGHGAPDGGAGALDGNVEVTDGGDHPQRWLAGRRFHYTVVVVDGGAAVDAYEGMLRRTQPQAARVQVARFTAGSVDAEMTAVRDADVVVCVTERAHDLVGAWAGGCRGAVLAPAAPAAALVEALAGIGMAPPEIRV